MFVVIDTQKQTGECIGTVVAQYRSYDVALDDARERKDRRGGDKGFVVWQTKQGGRVSIGQRVRFLSGTVKIVE